MVKNYTYTGIHTRRKQKETSDFGFIYLSLITPTKRAYLCRWKTVLALFIHRSSTCMKNSAIPPRKESFVLYNGFNKM